MWLVGKFRLTTTRCFSWLRCFSFATLLRPGAKSINLLNENNVTRCSVIQKAQKLRPLKRCAGYIFGVSAGQPKTFLLNERLHSVFLPEEHFVLSSMPGDIRDMYIF